MNPDDAKQAWQASVEIAGAPPLEEVRKGADKFYRYIWWRNFVEYAACMVVVVGFTSYIFSLPHVLQKIGSVLVVLGTLYVVGQLHRRASAVAPEQAGMMPLLQFTREQLVRQHGALRSIFWWYMLPFLPGMILIVTGTMLGERANGPQPFDAIAIAAMAALFAVVWWINQHGARKLQRHIDEVDALIGGNE